MRTMPSIPASGDRGRSAAGMKTRTQSVSTGCGQRITRSFSLASVARPTVFQPPGKRAWTVKFFCSGITSRWSPRILTPASESFLPLGNSIAHQTSCGFSFVPPP